MSNKTNMLIFAIIAIILSIYGVDTAIGGFRAGYDTSYALGALILPLIFWVITLHFFEKFRKENKKP